MTSISELLGEASFAEQRLRVCLDGKLLSRRRELQQHRAMANDEKTSLGEMSPRAVVQQELDAVDAEIRAKAHTFTIRAVGGQRWQELLTTHPDPDRRLAFDTVNFPPVAMASCVVDPAMTEEEARQLIAILNAGEINRIVDAIVSVNTQDGDVPFVVDNYDGTPPDGSS